MEEIKNRIRKEIVDNKDEVIKQMVETLNKFLTKDNRLSRELEEVEAEEKKSLEQYVHEEQNSADGSEQKS